MHTYEVTDDIRLAALRRLNILDTPPEKAFDDIVQLASHLFEVPISLVSLVEQDRQWFKACVGLDVSQTSREVSFCSHAIAQDDPRQVFFVADASKDPRFCDNPLVVGPPHIRMYAGAPLVTSEGVPIGSLCVIDSKPRQPTGRQLEALSVLARNVVAHLELRQATDELRKSEQSTRLVIDSALDAVISVSAGGDVTAWNPRAETLFGWCSDEAIGRHVTELVTVSADAERGGLDLPALMAVGSEIATERHLEMLAARRDGSAFPAELSLVRTQASADWMFTIFVRDTSDRKRQEELALEAATRDVAIFAMARLAESRDPETGAHLERVRSYCRLLAEQLRAMGHYADQIDDEFIRLLYSTSPLHDIGKVGIPDSVLLKPGRLSDREFEIMKTHAAVGAETLDAALERFPKTRFLRMARNIAATHHERFDGTGYPNGLKGLEIPLCGRIMALADVFDALSSKRVYKEAFVSDVVRSIILQDSGTHFDPLIVEAFEACHPKMIEIQLRFSESFLAAA